MIEDAEIINEKAGVNVKLKVYDEMPHDFLMAFVGLEESEDAWNTISEFIDENM